MTLQRLRPELGSAAVVLGAACGLAVLAWPLLVAAQMPKASKDPEDGAGARVALGRAYIQGLDDGVYTHVEAELFLQDAGAGRRRYGPIVGFLFGLDAWGASNGWGIGVPLSWYFGLRHPLFGVEVPMDLFLTAGLGADCLLFDHADSAPGFGVFSPLGRGNVGFDFGGLRLLGEVSAQVRWQWGAPDRVMFGAGGVLSLDSEWWDG
jgi:hypothetical protein